MNKVSVTAENLEAMHSLMKQRGAAFRRVLESKDNTLNELEIMIDNYKKADSWLTNTHITEESFKNLENVMIDNGLLDDYVSFND